MKTYTSTLSEEVFAELEKRAKELNVPKKRLIEKALRIYLDQLKRMEYERSYKRLSKDEDIQRMAEEGMEEYLKQLGE